MSNTKAYHDVERWVRDYGLPEKFKQRFDKKKLVVGRKSDGAPARHEFDAVSSNGKIVASVKASSDRTQGNNEGYGKRNAANAELMFLSLVTDSEKRLLVLTDKGFYQSFSRTSDGKKPEGVELMYIEPPEDLLARLKVAWKNASDEVSPKK